MRQHQILLRVLNSGRLRVRAGNKASSHLGTPASRLLVGNNPVEMLPTYHLLFLPYLFYKCVASRMLGAHT